MWHERILNKDEEPARKYTYLLFTGTHSKFNFFVSTHFDAAVTFEIGDRADPKTPNEEEPEWECVWKCHTAMPVHHMSFSPDGTLFATSGKSDRLVKIWYENKNGKSKIDAFTVTHIA